MPAQRAGAPIPSYPNELPMYASNHLLVLSQSDFIQHQLCTAITDATAPRGRTWLRFFHL